MSKEGGAARSLAEWLWERGKREVNTMEAPKDNAVNDQKSDVAEIPVPTEFLNVRLFTIILILFMCWRALEPLSLVMDAARRQALSPEVYLAIGLMIVEFSLWVVGLHLWGRVKIIGFWWMAVLAHLGFLASAIALLGGILEGRHTDSIGISGIKAGYIGFFLLLNIWSRRLFSFFKEINGACPFCHAGSVSEPKKKRSWTCPKCARTVLWIESARSRTH